MSRRHVRRLSIQALDERRVLASLAGEVFHDLDDSLHRDLNEVGLEGRVVYIDSDDDGEIDFGEPVTMTNASGAFNFDDLAEGIHAVRLFNGTSSQQQTTPSRAELVNPILVRADIEQAVARVTINEGEDSEQTFPGVIAIESKLHSIAADGTLDAEIDLGGQVNSLQRLADGSLLVLRDNGGTNAELVSVEGNLASSSVISSPAIAAGLSALAVDDLGRGVAITNATDSVRQFFSVEATGTGVINLDADLHPGSSILGDTTPRTNDGPTRSVVVSPEVGGGDTGVAVQFWSNTGSNFTSLDPFAVIGGTELAAFSDESSLLAVRHDSDLQIHDIDNNLATLYTLTDYAGPVAFDSARGLLVTLQPAGAGLELLDAETGESVAQLAIDLTALGEVSALSLDPHLEAVAIVGAAGFVEVNLRPAEAHRVAVTAGEAVSGIDFGVRVLSSNTAPGYSSPLELEMLEDRVFLAIAPGILGTATDPEGDQFIVLPDGDPNFGSVEIDPNGGMTFTPPPDFEGTVEVPVIVTDGGESIATTIQIAVVGIPDGPTSINSTIAPVPELILVNEPVGEIEIVDVDLVNEFEIEIDDPRFIVVDGEIIFVGPGPLDFELEEEIPLIITVRDPDADEEIEQSATITVTDSQEPISGIEFSEAGTPQIFENNPGDVVGQLKVIDPDVDDQENFYDFAVNDDRFVIDSFTEELKLANGVSVDAEASPTITIEVTATLLDDSFTQEFVITVVDVPEQPGEFLLSNASVMELDPEAAIGDLTISGNPAENGHTLTVNDARFVFEGSTLRLADDTWVVQAEQDEIEIEITADVDSSGGSLSSTETFIITVLPNDTPFHNDDLPEDVNDDGNVSARDALAIINYLNTYGPGPVGPGDPGFGYDVNADGEVTALDALIVINELNRGGGGSVGNEPEEGPSGEQIAEDDTNPAPSPPSAGDAVAPQGSDPTNRSSSGARFSDVVIEQIDQEEVTPQGTHDERDEEAQALASAIQSDSPTPTETTDQVFADESVKLLSDRC